MMPSQISRAFLRTNEREDSFHQSLSAQLASVARTDIGNAERLVKRYGAGIRYCHPWKKWLTWDGKRWKVDATAAIRRFAMSTVRLIYQEVSTIIGKEARTELKDWATMSESRSRVDAMIELASSFWGVPILPEELNNHPWLLNCANGTLDLRTGTLRSYRTDDSGA